jgi:hypothetical protein
MKKILGIMMLIICMLAGIVPHASAATRNDVTIEGIATNNGTPAVGFEIAINCKGLHFANFIGFALSDANGHYVEHTTTSFCPYGSTVEVRADPDNDGTFESSALGIASVDTVVNIVFGQNIAVPEYGLVGQLVAAVASIGVIMASRRRIRAGSK